MSFETASKLGLKRKNCWIDKRTHLSLRDLCAASVVGAFACPGPIAWEQLTELKIETRFGRLRSSFPSSKMTTPDY